MPVYGYGLLGKAPYKVAKTLPIKDVAKLHKIMRKAMSTFTYSRDQEFTSRIKYKNQVYILATFNFDKPNGVDSSANTAKLEALISKMNELLPSAFGSKSDKYRIDITGNWDNGAIIVLQKNPELEDKKLIFKPRDSKDKK